MLEILLYIVTPCVVLVGLVVFFAGVYYAEPRCENCMSVISEGEGALCPKCRKESLAKYIAE